MSRRIVAIVLALACVGGTAVAAAAQSDTAHPSVKPRLGGKRTHFAVTFTPPATAGSSGSTSTRYFVSASTRWHSARCASSVTRNVGQATAGTPVHVKLTPRSASHTWCRGRFSGQIEEVVSTTGGCEQCPPPPHLSPEFSGDMICPEIACPAAAIVRAQKIGTFSFRVRKHRVR